MNFLKLVQEVDTAMGTQGAISSVVGTSGYQSMLVDYVKNAWTDIQNLRKDWMFMKRKVTISLVKGQVVYTIFEVHSVVDDPVASWIVDRFNHDDNREKLIYMNPKEWDDRDQTDEVRPSTFTIRENSVLGYVEFDNPDAVYDIICYYYAKPQELAENVDIPYCPPEYHRLIKYQSIADLAGYLGNTETQSIYADKAENILGDMMRTQVPAKKAKPPRFI